MTDKFLNKTCPILGARLMACVVVLLPLATLRAQPPAVVACNVTVYPNDPDPKGTNIRKEASGKAAAVKRIADSDSQLEVTGSQGEWLRIRQVRSVDGTVTFKGDGWVYAPLMAVRAKGAASLHAEAEVKSAARGRLADDDQLAVLGCRGEWLHVRHTAATGWLEKKSQCANPVTTCS